jgi:hypothetical protein
VQIILYDVNKTSFTKYASRFWIAAGGVHNRTESGWYIQTLLRPASCNAASAVTNARSRMA